MCWRVLGGCLSCCGWAPCLGSWVVISCGSCIGVLACPLPWQYYRPLRPSPCTSPMHAHPQLQITPTTHTSQWPAARIRAGGRADLCVGSTDLQRHLDATTQVASVMSNTGASHDRAGPPCAHLPSALPSAHLPYAASLRTSCEQTSTPSHTHSSPPRDQTDQASSPPAARACTHRTTLVVIS